MDSPGCVVAVYWSNTRKILGSIKKIATSLWIKEVCPWLIFIWCPTAVKMQVVVQGYNTAVIMWMVCSCLKEHTAFINRSEDFWSSHNPGDITKSVSILTVNHVEWSQPLTRLCIGICQILTALRNTSTVETLLMYNRYTDSFVYGLLTIL